MNLLAYVEEDHALEAGKWNGVLYALGTDKKWKACSGPHGKGSAPKGVYRIEKPTPLEVGSSTLAYTDKGGFAWFAKMIPTFQTERTGFGIHPDGNVPGTLGCIGITESETKDLFEFLQSPDPTILFVV